MIPNPRWVVIGQYSNVQLKPLPLPSKKLPHKLGFMPKFLQKQGVCSDKIMCCADPNREKLN